MYHPHAEVTLSLHVTCSNFDKWPESWRERALCWLSEPEQIRLQRLAKQHRRDQFLAGRMLLRQRIAELYACDPGLIQLPASAPLQASSGAGRHLCFVSISHCGDFVAVALSANSVGIDCERHVGRRNWRDICAQYFTAEESKWLLRLPDDRGATEFLRCWTAKEALAKCGGMDLGRALTGVSLVREETRWSEEFTHFSAWNGAVGDNEVQMCLVCEESAESRIPDCQYRPLPDCSARAEAVELSWLPRRN